MFGISESAVCGTGMCSCLAGALHLSLESFAKLEKGTSTYLLDSLSSQFLHLLLCQLYLLLKTIKLNNSLCCLSILVHAFKTWKSDKKIVSE